MYQTKDNSSYDGKAFKLKLSAIFELQMYRDMSKVAEQYEMLKPKINNNKPIGKVVIISTVGDDDNNFKNIWNNEC